MDHCVLRSFRHVSFALAVDEGKHSEEVPTAPPAARPCVQGGATVEHQADHAVVSVAWLESQRPR